MNYEKEINQLKMRVDSLTESFLQAQRNQVPITNKVDDTSNRVAQITPWTASKTAYIGDTEVVFESAPQGNVSVFGLTSYQTERVSDNLVITFDALEEVTTVSISIQ